MSAATTRQRVLDDLRAQIVDGALAPGEPLREEQLAAAYDVSRHTVRSVLQALTAEHLVVTESYRGARVAAAEPARLRSLQQLRCALESEAVRLLLDRYGETWPARVTAGLDRALADFRAVADPVPTSTSPSTPSGSPVAATPSSRSGEPDWPAIRRSHAALHLAVVAAAESPRITETYAALTTELTVLLRAIQPYETPRRLVEEHIGYLASIQRLPQPGDVPLGAEAVREHLARSTGLLG